MRLAAIVALSALCACSDPRVGASISAGAAGVSVSPTLSGNLGGLNVVVSG